MVGAAGAHSSTGPLLLPGSTANVSGGPCSYYINIWKQLLLASELHYIFINISLSKGGPAGPNFCSHVLLISKIQALRKVHSVLFFGDS